jgi:hypothetical protein
MNKPVPRSKPWEEAKSPEGIEKRGELYPLFSPLTWAKRTPPSGVPAFEVLGHDVANMYCVLIPIIVLIMFFVRVFTDIRIPPVYFYGPKWLVICLFLYVIHYWLIKWHPCLKRINKFFALFLIKIIPIFVAFGFCSRAVISS